MDGILPMAAGRGPPAPNWLHEIKYFWAVTLT